MVGRYDVQMHISVPHLRLLERQDHPNFIAITKLNLCVINKC